MEGNADNKLFADAVNRALEQIEIVSKFSWEKLHEVKPGETIELKKISKTIEEIDRLKQDISQIKSKYDEIVNSLFNKKSLNNEIEITISGNALKESYLTLSKAFSEGICTLDDINEEITIITPYEEFKTQINPNKRLKARGKIAKFYEESDVLEGETVTFRKLDDRVYEISANSYRYV